MKTGNWGILAVVLGILAMAGTAQAAFVDAISVNLNQDSNGTVGLTNSTPQAGSVGNWINMQVIGSNAANSRASADGSGWTSTTFSSPTLTANGAGLGSFAVQLYDGGWAANSSWDNSGVSANTLERQGIRNGDMPSGWGPTALSVELQNMPAAWQASGYDVFILAGPTTDGLNQTWMQVGTAETGATFNSGSFPALSIRTVSAIQAGAVPEPVTMSLLAMGGLALLLRRKSKIRRGGRS